MHTSIKKMDNFFPLMLENALAKSTIGLITLCHETVVHSLFDSNIMHFYSFFIRVIFPYKGKMVPGLARAMERTMNFFQ